MSTINIIMATYNGEVYIREQIDSILENTYQDWILTICDDGSLDNTIQIAKEYVNKYPGKIFLHQNEKNLGVMFNFLYAIQRCNTKYIMFCDQDDVWKSEKIQVTYDRMLQLERTQTNNQKHILPNAVFSDALVVDEKLNVIHTSFHKAGALDVEKLDLPHILMENKLIGCTVMINSLAKDMLATLPKTARMHDWWIAILCASFGQLSFIKEPTLLYRQHTNNVIGGNLSFLSYAKNRMKSIKKQKEILRLTQIQAENFYEIYENLLPMKSKKVIYEFASLKNKKWFVKRCILLKYGFLKTGIIRNIGVLLLI